MDKYLQLQQFVNLFNDQVPLAGYLISFAFTLGFSMLAGWVYTRFGTSISNRSSFSRTFPLLALTTMLIITIVKSSLALSLGLVGALSIVRFRAAIKEPEELAYLFLVISIGLGFGAGQILVTTIGIILILTALVAYNYRSPTFKTHESMYVTVSAEDDETSQKLTPEKITKILMPYTKKIDLKHFERINNTIEISYLVEFLSVDAFSNVNTEIQELSPKIHITCIDNSGIL